MSLPPGPAAWERSIARAVSGKRTLWTTINPPERADLLWGSVFITPDGHAYAYRYRRMLTSLFTAEGLR